MYFVFKKLSAIFLLFLIIFLLSTVVNTPFTNNVLAQCSVDQCIRCEDCFMIPDICGGCDMCSTSQCSGYSEPPQLDWSTLYQTVWPNDSIFRVTQSTTAGQLVTRLLGFILPISGLVLIMYIIYGGIMMMTSGGEQQKYSSAKAVMTNGLLGLIIIFTSFWIVQFVSYALGLNNFGGLFN